MATPSSLPWRSDRELRFPGLAFDLDWTSAAADRSSTAERFVVAKTREMVEFYNDRFAGGGVRNIVEIGIFKGGSVALLSQLLRPEKFVAIDLSRERVAALDEWIARNRLTGVVRPYYGVDQADAPRLRQILQQEIGTAGVDLVVDDGCHLLRESRAAFNAVFPFVRPGGAYVVEDWAWAHWPGEWQDHGGPWASLPATTQLVFELVMVAASYPELIASVEARADLAVVRRGAAPVPEGFDISSSYRAAGRNFGEYVLPAPPPRRLVDRAAEIVRNEGMTGLGRRIAWRLRSKRAR
jgi:SAM-dependent methyltransferase